MATNSEVLVQFQGVDNVSPVAQQIGRSVGDLGGGFKGTMGQLGSIFSGMNGLIMGAFGAFGLSSFKNMTYGYATAREELLSLHNAMYGTGEEANKLWDEMDTMTTAGLTQLDNLTQVMSNFKMSTGASTNQARDFAVQVNKIGNMALLMGKSEAQSTMIMMGAIQGLNGNFRTLQFNLGITRDKLKKMGWSGNAKDIDGYTKALKKYLESIKTDDLLNSTQGKIISLQKQFRITGRNIGMAYLPLINAILDGVTKINAESDNMLAKVVILGTGGLSLFASFLPTLSPLIQLYTFLEDRIDNLAMGTSILNNRFTTTRQVVGTLNGHLRIGAKLLHDWVNVPIYNYLKEFIDIANTPIGRMFDSLQGGATRFIKLPLANHYSKLISLTHKWFTIPMGKVLNSVSASVGGLIGRYSKFISVYGSSIVQERNALIMQRLKVWWSERNAFFTKQQAIAEGYLSKELINSAMAHTSQIGLIDAETLATEENTLAKEEGVLSAEAEAIARGEGALASIFSGTAKEGESLATLELNDLIAIQTGLLIAQAEAQGFNTAEIIASTGALEAETVATAETSAGFLGLAGAESLALWPILLIIGAIVALVAVGYEIGKMLGWWDNWSTMLEAITSGLRRLWSAFINNPNVQGFIKDIQGLFGALGGAISWVAWQVLQLFGWEDDGSEFDFVRFLIDGFGTLGRILGDIVNAIKRTVSAFAGFINFLATTDGPIGFVRDGLKTIICALVGCSPGIVPALEKVGDVFNSIFGGIVSFISNPVGTIVGRFKEIITGAEQIGDMIGGFVIRQINKFLDFLGPLGSVIRNIFSGALPILAQIVGTIAGTIGQVWGVISDMFSGKITVDQGISKIIAIIKPTLQILYQIFVSIFNRIKNYVINTAKNMVNGFIGFILSIPQRVMGIFNTLLTNLFNLPSQVFNTGKEIGQGIYDGIDDTVSGLTGGIVHLPGANTNKDKKGQAKSNAKTVGNATKNYNNTGKTRHYTINVGKGAIQLDASNLTTKESKQIMINALEGLTSLSPVNTKANAQK